MSKGYRTGTIRTSPRRKRAARSQVSRREIPPERRGTRRSERNRDERRRDPRLRGPTIGRLAGVRGLQGPPQVVLRPQGGTPAGSGPSRGQGTPALSDLSGAATVPAVRPQQPRVRLLGRRERGGPPSRRLHRDRTDRRPGTAREAAARRLSVKKPGRTPTPVDRWAGWWPGSRPG